MWYRETDEVVSTIGNAVPLTCSKKSAGDPVLRAAHKADVRVGGDQLSWSSSWIVPFRHFPAG